jgi:phosphatidylserine/phosphatidylglycerophosphate/cardiolipin synthase-like enzyme
MRLRVVALVGGLALALVAGLGLQALVPSGARGSGNPLCPPVVTPTPTPTPTPTVGSTVGSTPVVHQARCTLPWLPGWRPRLGVVFNDPLGAKADAQAIIRRVVAAIRHTPKGATVRIAVYSFDRSEVASALRKARARGVRVQVVVNSRVMSGTARRLQKVLGRNPAKSSFLIACKGSCRGKGDGGNLHVKVYSFSRTGGARDLVIVSSGNLTSKAVYRQWNDSFAISQDTGLFDAWVSMFTQLKDRRRVGARVIGYVASNGAFGASWSRISAQGTSTTSVSAQASGRYRASGDPVVRRMQRVGCAAPAGYGAAGHTVVRITMYAMFKARGEAIARQLARLKRAGCDIRIITSVPGGLTSRILARAGIATRNADWLFTERDPLLEDGIGGFGPRFYSHLKVMALSGTYAGKPTRTVWTGSENWDALSFANEEVVLQVSDPAVYDAYARRFVQMWNGRATHRSGIEPTYGP